MYKITVEVNVEETVYTAPSDWRLIGAKGKSKNIVTLCENNCIKPIKILEVGAGEGSILYWLDKMNFCRIYCNDLFTCNIHKRRI